VSIGRNQPAASIVRGRDHCYITASAGWQQRRPGPGASRFRAPPGPRAWGRPCPGAEAPWPAGCV